MTEWPNKYQAYCYVLFLIVLATIAFYGIRRCSRDVEWHDSVHFQENTCRFRIGNVRCRWYRNSGISSHRFIPYTRSYPVRVLSRWTGDRRSIYHRYCFIYRALTRLERSSFTSLTRDNARKIHHGGIARWLAFIALWKISVNQRRPSGARGIHLHTPLNEGLAKW